MSQNIQARHRNSTQASLPAPEDRPVIEDFLQFVGIVRRGWRYLAISVLVCLTIAVLFLARLKPVYKGSIQLLILQHRGQSLNGMVGGGRDLRIDDPNDNLPTHIMIIRSPAIIKQALESIKRESGPSGLKDLSVAEVRERLKVTRPDPSVDVLEITYRASTESEATRVIEAVTESYEKYLDENYHDNAKSAITLISKARDELLQELTDLEKKYLEFHEKHPVFTAAEDGRSLLVRRLDKWDAAANEAMIKAVQLKSQLELGEKLSAEGHGLWAVANALRLLGSDFDFNPQPSLTLGGNNYEQVKAQLAEVEQQRRTSERLLDHLRSEQASAYAARPISEEDVAQAFYAEPEALALFEQLKVALSKYDANKRVVRNPNDPSMVQIQKRVRMLQDQLGMLWQRRKNSIRDMLARGTADETQSAVRKAEADLVVLKAQESVLREQLEPLEAKHVRRQSKTGLAGRTNPASSKEVLGPSKTAVESEENELPGQNGAALESIKRGLSAIESMQAEMRRRFEKDLAAAKDTEIDRLTGANLKANLERHRTLFNSVVDQLKQAQLVSDHSTITAKTLIPTNTFAVRPWFVTILFLATLSGGLIGVGIAYVVDLLDGQIRTLPEIRRALDISLLGLIPQLRREAEMDSAEIGLISHTAPRSMIAEAYKSIRTNLEFHRRQRHVQVLLITSPHSGDGKSTSASNLAISLAHAGKKVLLVDADLRRPSQHLLYNLGRDRGLVHFLKNLLPFHLIVQPTAVENLHLIGAGPEVANPAELLASHRFGEFVEVARQSYDLVLIDSSPLLAVTDPSIIGASTDGIVLIVRATSIKRHEAERTVELLRNLGAPVLGTVINGITNEQMGHGYGYGQRYGYGYGTYGSTSGPRSIEESASIASAARSSNGATDHPVSE